jgi:hypothetical protein
LRVVVPFFYWLDRALRAVPLIGRPLAGLVHHIFPVNLSLNSELRVLDTLDWYSPKYQSKHTYEQVFRWFENSGLEALTVADVSIGVKGSKPIRKKNGLREIPSDLSNVPDSLAYAAIDQANTNTLQVDEGRVAG